MDAVGAEAPVAGVMNRFFGFRRALRRPSLRTLFIACLSSLLAFNFIAAVVGVHESLLHDGTVQHIVGEALSTLTQFSGTSATRQFQLLFDRTAALVASASRSPASSMTNQHAASSASGTSASPLSSSAVLFFLEDSFAATVSAVEQTSSSLSCDRDAALDDEDEAGADSPSSAFGYSHDAATLEELEVLRGIMPGNSERTIVQTAVGGGSGVEPDKAKSAVAEESKQEKNGALLGSSVAFAPLHRFIFSTVVPGLAEGAAVEHATDAMLALLKSGGSFFSINSSSLVPSAARPILPPPSVVTVVGAGLAGLIATREVLAANPNAIVVLVEGGGSLGGRVANVPYPPQQHEANATTNSPSRGRRQPMIEIGATFIHGVEDNPMTRLAHHYKIKTRAVNYDSLTIFDADGRGFADAALVDIVKDRVYNVARSIFFAVRDWRSRRGLRDVALDVIYREAIAMALYGIKAGSGDKEDASSESLLPPAFQGAEGQKALFTIVKNAALAKQNVQKMHSTWLKDNRCAEGERNQSGEVKYEHNDETVSYYLEPALRDIASMLGGCSGTSKILSFVQQILSWHFYWEIVQDQIAPLSALGSYAYDNSLGFRGPDHVVDDERGMQALMDAIITDIATIGGAITADRAHTPVEVESEGAEKIEGETHQAVTVEDVVEFTPCADVPAALQKALADYHTSPSTSAPKRRLIVAVDCSASQITDNQLPSVQNERRAEMQSILDNKRLAHRRELLGGSGSSSGSVVVTDTQTAINKRGETETSKQALSPTEVEKKDSEAIESDRASPSFASSSSAVATVPLSKASAATFALVFAADLLDGLVCNAATHVVIPIATFACQSVLGTVRVVAVLFSEAFTFAYNQLYLRRADFSFTPHLGERLWAAFVGGANIFVESSGSVVFDVEQIHASLSTRTAQARAKPSLASNSADEPLPSLLPHHLKVAANEKRDMQRRAVKGEEAIPDRAERMAERRRLGSDKVIYFNRLAGGGGADNDDEDAASTSFSSSGGRRGGRANGRKAPPRPESRRSDSFDDDEASGNGNAVSGRNNGVGAFAKKAFDSVRSGLVFGYRYAKAVLKGLRRQYRLMAKRPTSAANKLLFLVKNPLAALKLLLTEEQMVSVLVTAGVVGVDGEGLFSQSPRQTSSLAVAQSLIRVTNGIRTNAVDLASAAHRVKKTQTTTSTSADLSPLWWDSDVVVVTAPLGVLQQSLSKVPAKPNGANKQQQSASQQQSIDGIDDGQHQQQQQQAQSVGMNTPKHHPRPNNKQKNVENTILSPMMNASLLSSGTVTAITDMNQGLIKFTPPLPLKKREAIAGTGCSETLKLALQFDVSKQKELFWPEDVEFFGIVLRPPLVNVSEEAAGEFAIGDAAADASSEWSSSPLLPFLLGDAGHIEIVNLHKLRNRNGMLILEVENALARHWSSIANHTALIEKEVMPRLRAAFCRKQSDNTTANASVVFNSSCKVPSMPRWFSVNNYIRNPHIRCGFSYWRPEHDGRDNLVLRAGLWPSGHATAAADHSRLLSGIIGRDGGGAGGAFSSSVIRHPSLLFSPLTPSLSHHQNVNLRSRMATASAVGLSGTTAVSIAGLNRLLFAGEHTSPDLYGNMHGAVVEGQRAAIEVHSVLEALKQHAFTDRLVFWRRTCVGRAMLSIVEWLSSWIALSTHGNGNGAFVEEIL